MSKKLRVRFAPSPTGALHIGGVRTALYNYLLAHKLGGTFILRIEDTDQTRFVEGAENYILDALKWLGIMPDEGIGVGGPHEPYRQSERKELYKVYADELINSGKAFDKSQIKEFFVDVGARSTRYHCFRYTLCHSLESSGQGRNTFPR